MVKETIEKIQKEATERAVKEIRFIDKISLGQVVRQGDIYIHCVDKDHKHGQESKTAQLAIGSTQGSRHFANGECTCFEGTTLPEWCASGTFLGPFVEVEKRSVITHQEHAHVSLPVGYYQITHQMDARSLQRVRD